MAALTLFGDHRERQTSTREILPTKTGFQIDALGYVTSMFIAGTRLTENDVAALTDTLRHNSCTDEAMRIAEAYGRDEHMLRLSGDERRRILAALHDCPDDLRLLRVGLQEQL